MKRKTRWIDEMGTPCDPDVFLRAVAAWERGRDVPIRHPEQLQPGRLYLADVDVNRAVMETVRELRAAGVPNPQAYLWRVMHLGEIFRAAPALGLGDLVREDEVHTALLRAAAVAKFRVPVQEVLRAQEDVGVFDLDDVVAKTAQFRQAQKAAG